MGKVQSLLLSLSTVVCLSACAQTKERVISNYINAIGGAAPWKKVNTIQTVGTMNLKGNEMQLSIIGVNGKGYRMDYAVSGMAGYSVITPTRGWYFNPGGQQSGPDTLSSEQLKKSIDGLDIQGKLIDYNEKGHKVVYQGTEKVERVDCDKLVITLNTGKEETWYIDRKDHYVVQTVAHTKTGDKEEVSTVKYSNYKKLPEGIVYPMSLSTDNGDITFTSVEINKPIEEKLFHRDDTTAH